MKLILIRRARCGLGRTLHLIRSWRSPDWRMRPGLVNASCMSFGSSVCALNPTDSIFLASKLTAMSRAQAMVASAWIPLRQLWAAKGTCLVSNLGGAHA